METYRSGHNGADSKSVSAQAPASSNLAVSAKKTQLHLCVTESFRLWRDSNRTFGKADNKLPVDVWQVRVRAGATVAPGESRILAKKTQLHFCVAEFFICGEIRTGRFFREEKLRPSGGWSQSPRACRADSRLGRISHLSQKDSVTLLCDRVVCRFVSNFLIDWLKNNHYNKIAKYIYNV